MATTTTTTVDSTNGLLPESCPICYERFHDVEEGVVIPVPIEGCHHVFCQGCLRGHCELAIHEKKLPIACPMLPKCSNTFTETQVRNIVCPEWHESNDEHNDGNHPLLSSSVQLWNKYQRVQRKLHDPSLVSCTKCDAILPKPNQLDECDAEGNNDTPRNHQCPFCNHSFCSLHGDLHFGMTCDEYHASAQGRTARANWKRSERAVKKFTKPCSHCSAPIQLVGGCDHVVCPACHNDFCFRCGTHVHLTGDFIRHCHLCNQHYMDHRKTKQLRIRTCLLLPVTLPLALVYMALVSVAVILSCGCCCCYACGTVVGGDDQVAPLMGARVILWEILVPLLNILRGLGIECYPPWLIAGIERDIGLEGDMGQAPTSDTFPTEDEEDNTSTTSRDAI